MIQRKTRTRLLQDSQKELGLAVILMAIFLPGVGSALTPQFPVVDVVKGETAAGRPYMKGGLSSDEQLVMECATRPYNLKLKFTRRVGTPAAPSFIVIGANDGRSIEKAMLARLGSIFSCRAAGTRFWLAFSVKLSWSETW